MKTIYTSVLSLLILSSLLLAGCAREERTGRPDQTAPVNSGASGIGPEALRGLDAREALALTNRWGTGTPEIRSYVDTEAVKITFEKTGKTVEIPLPEDRIVVAFAPYLSNTHPCEIHYMSGCQGELVEKTVYVTALLPDGEVLIDEAVRTMKNGFFELWLPRNREITITMEALGGRAEGTITTFSDSNTCITTFQLM
jgi:hypothetical protein